MIRSGSLAAFLAPLLTAVLLQACSGPAPVSPRAESAPPPVVEMPPVGPPFRALYASDGRVMDHDLSVDRFAEAGSFSGSVIERFPAPSGRVVALVSRDGDSLRLGIADADRARWHVVFAAAEPVVITAAWSADGSRLAFGHYVPTRRDARPAMGDGDVLEVDLADGRAAGIGCSASRAVLAWLPDGSLLVRDTDNLYVVADAGCETRSTVDARRMHRLSASPDGRHIAYVHRELVYDRQRRAYVPDSTLMISAPDGSSERKIVAFRYRPERLAWKGDGTELAYDVEHPDRPGVRLISLFDVASGTNAYLHPPMPDGPSEFDPRWSPGGGHLVFRRVDTDGNVALAVRTFSNPFAVLLEGTEGAQPIGWTGENALVVRLETGVVRVFRLDGGAPFDLPAGADPLAVVSGS